MIAGLAAALGAGAFTAYAVALEARRIADASDVSLPTVTRNDDGNAVAPQEAGGGELRPVASLTERRLRASQLPADTRPLPTVDQYDALLPSRRNHR